MTKSRAMLHIRLPAYVSLSALSMAAPDLRRRGRAPTSAEDHLRRYRLALKIRLYLRTNALEQHNVDNRLKDIMHALHGRFGDPKAVKPRGAVIANDRQIWHVTVEKGIAAETSPRAGP